MKILLVCANGASTGVLVEKMRHFSAEHEVLKTKGITIEAVSFDSLRKFLDAHPVEVVLVAPQIRFKEEEVKEICEKKNIKAGVINTSDYGRMNAPAVLKFAIDLFKK